MIDNAQIPSGWASCSLGELLSTAVTRVEPEDIQQDAWLLELEDIEKDSSTLLQRKTFSERRSRSTKAAFQKGDVLYGKLRPYLNKVLLAEEDGFCTTEIIPLRPSPAVTPGFLMYALRHPDFVQYATESSHGLSMPRLGTPALRSAQILVPPISEQKRIVHRLDGALARARNCQDRLSRYASVVQEFRRVMLEAAYSGRLTADWRAVNESQTDSQVLVKRMLAAHSRARVNVENAAAPTDEVHDLQIQDYPDSWTMVMLRDVVEPSRPITYGILKPGPDLRRGVPYIRVADYPTGELDFASIRRTSSEIDEEFRRSRLIAGDLLLSIRGTVGRVVVIPPEMDGANITQDSARISLQSLVNTDFILHYLRSDSAQLRMLKATKGVAVRGINIGDVRALQIPLPSRYEQDEIVRRLDALLSIVGRLEERYLSISEALGRIAPTLIAKAFRGELVPQNPDDEPAASLLERSRVVMDAPQRKTSANRQRTRASKRTKSERALMDVLSELDDWVPAEEAFYLCGVDNQTSHERIEQLYAELRDLDRSGRLETSLVRDESGRKLHDRIKLTR